MKWGKQATASLLLKMRKVRTPKSNALRNAKTVNRYGELMDSAAENTPPIRFCLIAKSHGGKGEMVR